jgi:beta-glucosidase
MHARSSFTALATAAALLLGTATATAATDPVSHPHVIAHFDLSAGRQPDGTLRVSFKVTNTGGMEADEVPQVYLGPPANAPSGVQFAVKALAAFDRITLPAGGSQVVNLSVQPRELSYWSTPNQRWQVATGQRSVFVGSSSRDVRLQTNVTIAG